MPTNDRRMLTTGEAAEVIGVTRRRVQAMIAAGQIRAEKLGRDYLITEAEAGRVRRTDRKPGRPKKDS